MKRLVLRTTLPALLAIGLFSGVVFFSFLPSLSRAVMDQKRLMIRELTDASWNILARFEAEERADRLSRAEAQTAAVEQTRSLHYGQEGKDYFWIIDMQPRMIVHPYRPDLEGTDLSQFADPHGKLIFVEMARVVQENGAGYVSYMWQWKDDPERIVPKLSYVKGFAPWGWIIGTGVYTDDVRKKSTARWSKQPASRSSCPSAARNSSPTRACNVLWATTAPSSHHSTSPTWYAPRPPSWRAAGATGKP